MKRHALWLALVTVMTAAAPAYAESSRDSARRHYDEGQALFRAGAYEAALAEFRAANSAMPNPITLKSQAECLERLGRYDEAVAMFEQYLQQAPSAPDAADIRARIQRYRSRGGRLRIYSNPSGAAVTLDGQRINGMTPMEVDVSPGRHAVAIEMQGYQMALEEFNMSGGAGHTVNVSLIPVAGAQQPSAYPSTTQPQTEQGGRWRVTTPVWVMIGVTGAALITGIVTGSLALVDQGDFDDRIDQEGVTGDNRSSLQDLGDSGTVKALVADISFGVAGAAAITGLILFFVQNRHRNSQTADRPHRIFSLSPTLTGQGGGLQLGGTF